MERRELAARLGGTSAAAEGASIAVEERAPAMFMRRSTPALGLGGNVFHADPVGRAAVGAALAGFMGAEASGERGWLMIPSGGASGGLKFARHDGWTVAAAVRGFCGHLGMERVNAVGVLPLHHVSGFMAWMRSALTGGRYIPWAWKEIEAGRFPGDLPPACCISLVPTQLQRLLASPMAVDWLRGFRAVFVGGGPTWEGLLEEGARLGLPLSPSYGATETAAMVAALRPEQFLAGVRGCGAALPHARIEVEDGGILRVSAESLFRGYFPGTRAERTWATGDLGSFDGNGSLVVAGRSDDVIVTGGKKVSPAEVEAALRASGEFDDVAVLGLPDPQWGSVVVACHPQGARPPRPERVSAALSGLASYKHPKRYLAVAPWPRNAQGKINRSELSRLAAGR